MWVWWIVSVIVLVICIIFAVRVFATSRQLQRLISFSDTSSRVSQDTNLKIKPNITIIRQEQEIAELRLKLRMLEENSINHAMLVSRLSERMEKMEGLKAPGENSSKNEDENWEELYYDLIDKNDKLESELDLARIKLEDLEVQVAGMLQNERVFSLQQSNAEKLLLETHSLQNNLGELQQKLEGALEREEELRAELSAQVNSGIELTQLKQQYARLQSEATELRNRITEISNRDILLQHKLTRLAELESSVQNSEYEKIELQKTVEDIISENTLLAGKLTELQEKLRREKLL